MTITKQGGSLRRHRDGRGATYDPIKYSIMDHNENILASFSSFADAALVSRYLDGGNLPESECIRAQEIMKGI